MTVWFLVEQRVAFLSPLFGGQSVALMWAQGADKMPAEGYVFAHYWKETHVFTDRGWSILISSDCTGNGAATYRNLPTVPEGLLLDWIMLVVAMHKTLAIAGVRANRWKLWRVLHGLKKDILCLVSKRQMTEWLDNWYWLLIPWRRPAPSRDEQ